MRFKPSLPASVSDNYPALSFSLAGCSPQQQMVARTHQPARPPIGHHNWRRPDSV